MWTFDILGDVVITIDNWKKEKGFSVYQRETWARTRPQRWILSSYNHNQISQ